MASMRRTRLFYLALSGVLRQPPLNKPQQLKMRGFFCLRGTCYIYLSFSRRPCCWRLCGGPQRGIPENVNPLITAKPGSDKKEECDGTHATRTETGVFQRRPAQGGNHWLRLRRLAAGASLRRSRDQRHGI